MHAPLTQWTCDICGDMITDAKDGYVIWQKDEGHRGHQYRIIHHGDCDRDDYSSSLPLTEFLGAHGIAVLTAQLSAGVLMEPEMPSTSCHVKNFDEFVDFFRRVQLPYYEEARRRFGDHDVQDRFCDANELFPYLPDIIEGVGNPDQEG